MSDEMQDGRPIRRIEIDIAESSKVWGLIKVLLSPLVGIVGLISGGLITYHSTRILNNEDKLASIRSAAYIDFANAEGKYRSFREDKKTPYNPDFYQAKIRVALFGDDDVVKALAKVVAYEPHYKCDAPNLDTLEFWLRMRSHVTREPRSNNLKSEIALLALGCVLDGARS